MKLNKIHTFSQCERNGVEYWYAIVPVVNMTESPYGETNQVFDPSLMASYPKSFSDLVRKLEERGCIWRETFTERFHQDLLLQYAIFLHEWNEVGGFFSKNDSERILERHFYESLVFVNSVVEHFPVSRETTICDIGSGPGLPGYLFACLKEAPRLTLVDSSKRRLGKLEDWGKKSGTFTGVETLYSRVEEIKRKFDLVTVRALVPFPFCLELSMRMQRIGGTFVLFGTDPVLSDHSGNEYPYNLGYQLDSCIEPEEIQFLGKRTINILKKNGESAKGYPRNWKQIKEAMEKWEK